MTRAPSPPTLSRKTFSLSRWRERAGVRVGTLAITLLLAACSTNPPPPDWQSNAKSAMDTTIAAILAGDSRAETQEFDRARTEIARTGRPDLLARAELMRCAAHVASLTLAPCDGFERLRRDAAAPERAYADYLAARPLSREDLEHLPAAQRTPPSGVAGIADPLSRLIAIAVLFQSGQAPPPLIANAVDTASAQGWRRPLLAWLKVQSMLAERAGEAGEAERLQRRIELVQAGK